MTGKRNPGERRVQADTLHQRGDRYTFQFIAAREGGDDTGEKEIKCLTKSVSGHLRRAGGRLFEGRKCAAAEKTCTSFEKIILWKQGPKREKFGRGGERNRKSHL